MRWRLELRGGAYDGWSGELTLDPEPRLIVWVCADFKDACPGHATLDAHDDEIDLRTCEVYKLVETDGEQRLAVYEVGESRPDGDEVDEGVLVGAGAGYTMIDIDSNYFGG